MKKKLFKCCIEAISQELIEICHFNLQELQMQFILILTKLQNSFLMVESIKRNQRNEFAFQ